MALGAYAVAPGETKPHERALAGAGALAAGFASWKVANYGARLLFVKEPKAIVVAALAGGVLIGGMNLFFGPGATRPADPAK